jgi:hypothetical protein
MSCSSLTSLVTQRASIEYISHWASGVGLRKNRGRTRILSRMSQLYLRTAPELPF